MCGHFPEGVETFEQEALNEHETKGEWYLRQMLGSANISGSKALHLLSGNLSHQIEHHLFPDLPSNRYYEIAPRVREVFQRYGLRYHAAPLVKQVGSAWHKVLRLSLPNGWLDETGCRTPRRRSPSCSARPASRPRGLFAAGLAGRRLDVGQTRAQTSCARVGSGSCPCRRGCPTWARWTCC